MKKTVIVCYQEKEYVCRLVSYLNRNSKNLYLAYAMTKEQEVADYVQKQAVALLLLSEEYETAKWSKKVSQVCVLTEREAAQENEISIYTSAQEIVEYIRLRIREQLEYVRDKLSLEAYVQYSGEGKQWPLTLAKKSGFLYWEWNPYSAYEQNLNVEQLIYDIKNRDETFARQLKECVIEVEQTQVLPATRYCFDMRQINAEDIHWFLENAAILGYAGVMIDFDIACVGQADVFKEFTKIWIHKDNCPVFEKKYKSFIEYLSWLGISEAVITVVDNEL